MKTIIGTDATGEHGISWAIANKVGTNIICILPNVKMWFLHREA